MATRDVQWKDGGSSGIMEPSKFVYCAGCGGDNVDRHAALVEKVMFLSRSMPPSTATMLTCSRGNVCLIWS